MVFFVRRQMSFLVFVVRSSETCSFAASVARARETCSRVRHKCEKKKRETKEKKMRLLLFSFFVELH